MIWLKEQYKATMDTIGQAITMPAEEAWQRDQTLREGYSDLRGFTGSFVPLSINDTFEGHIRLIAKELNVDLVASIEPVPEDYAVGPYFVPGSFIRGVALWVRRTQSEA